MNQPYDGSIFGVFSIPVPIHELLGSLASIQHAFSTDDSAEDVQDRTADAIAKAIRTDVALGIAADYGVNLNRVAFAAGMANVCLDAKNKRSESAARLERYLLIYVATHLGDYEARSRASAYVAESFSPSIRVHVATTLQVQMEAVRALDDLLDLSSAAIETNDREALSGVFVELSRFDRKALSIGRDVLARHGLSVVHSDGNVGTDDELRRVFDASTRALRSAGVVDYAPNEMNRTVRLLTAARMLSNGEDVDAEILKLDLRYFNELASAHEVSANDVRRVRDAFIAAEVSASKHVAGLSERIRRLEDERERLKRISNAYGAGPAHMRTLEQQFVALKYNHRLNDLTIRPRYDGRVQEASALQNATIDALRTAEAYCWTSVPVEAVASAATTLLPEMAISPEALGSFALPGKAGWWYFADPIPMKVTRRSAVERPVVALLWRREFGSNGKAGVWLSLFVDHEFGQASSGFTIGPTPVLAWVWVDGQRLDEMETVLRENFAKAYRDPGSDHATLEECVSAAKFFSRFFLAAMSWLRQKIATTTRGEGVRQVSRAIEREHKLDASPKVQIVHLRARERSVRESDGTSDATVRKLSCRFSVTGHWRNQYYASTGKHVPKFIESFVKGPSEAPFRERAKVYAVVR